MELHMSKKTTVGLTACALKNLAVAAMLFDHFIAVFWQRNEEAGLLLRIPGRIVAPIMCYMIAEGFYRTSNVKKYLARLLLFAALSHFPYVFYFELSWWRATGVIWSLFLGLLSLTVARHPRLPFLVKAAGIFVCCLLAYPADWNYIAVLWILFFGLFHEQWEKQAVCFAAIGLLFLILPAFRQGGLNPLVCSGIFLALPLIRCYNGQRGAGGRIAKWGFYLFYPAHLMALELLKLALGV